jgi:hypothetical protein
MGLIRFAIMIRQCDVTHFTCSRPICIRTGEVRKNIKKPPKYLKIQTMAIDQPDAESTVEIILSGGWKVIKFSHRWITTMRGYRTISHSLIITAKNYNQKKKRWCISQKCPIHNAFNYLIHLRLTFMCIAIIFFCIFNFSYFWWGPFATWDDYW